MQEMTAPGAAGARSLLLSRFAADRLLRLQSALARQRTAEQFLHGPALDQARALLARAVFTLYLDCRVDGAGEDARRLLAAVDRTPPTAPPMGHNLPEGPLPDVARGPAADAGVLVADS